MNHRRILGWVFLVWAGLQVAGTLAVWASGMLEPSPWWLVTVAVAAIYGWGAWRLLKTSAPVWILALGLSIAALFSFPLGTVVGAYGLWAALARRDQLGGSYAGWNNRQREA